MTVGELIQHLSKFDPSLSVFQFNGDERVWEKENAPELHRLLLRASRDVDYLADDSPKRAGEITAVVL